MDIERLKCNDMRKWYMRYFDYDSLMLDFLNKLAKEGIQPDSIKIKDYTIFYFSDAEITYTT